MSQSAGREETPDVAEHVVALGPRTASVRRDGDLPTIDPTALVRPGRFDAASLLVVWMLRRLFVPVLVVGAIVGTVVIGGDAPEPDFGSPREVVALLLSPWAGVALAIVLRVIANWLALLLAVPLTGRARPSAYEGGAVARWARAGLDRLWLARGFREQRWTWPVRELAADRLGVLGRRLRVADVVVTVVTSVVVGLVVVAGLVVLVRPGA